MSNHSSRHGAWALAPLILAAALALGACTSGGETSGDGVAAAESESQMQARDAGSNDATNDASATSALSADVLAQRSIERRGALLLSADKVAAARDGVVDVAGRMGGYLGSENTSGNDGSPKRASLQVVVPTDRFDDAMAALGDIGKVVSREQSADDVTDEVVDVDSRVASAKSSLTRVRALLDRATTLGAVIRLESELGDRQADLESLQARQQSLATRTSTATIDVTIHQDAKEVAPLPNEDDNGFGAGLAAGWGALTEVGTGLLTGIGAALPFAVALGVPAGVVLLLVRRLRRRRVPAAG